jgi:hypothetical protein
MRLEPPFRIARLIADPKLPLDQVRDALGGLRFGGKPAATVPLVEEPPQAGPGLLIQTKELSWNKMGLMLEGCSSS